MVDKKEDKVSRILTAIENMQIGETTNPTNLARGIGIHPDTLRAKIDEYDLARSIQWRNVRDKSGKVRQIIREDEDLNLRKEMRDLKKEVLDVKNMLDEINAKLSKQKK